MAMLRARAKNVVATIRDKKSKDLFPPGMVVCEPVGWICKILRREVCHTRWESEEGCSNHPSRVPPLRATQIVSIMS
jgi:hypothetical protein